eukprot:CAMPEP_0202899958 /NCGR_PEP_ID=MMETSP1392-20130828/9353_1 /ASSEMBLY_ACC=CAM_ASM_000868 /TAXON_ID=225041 /ORGANISM="Chlamydomonas chlamydogama, Strain SAG 11-48b" /LENGTH=298 /DNA_ID=CAMNT_0049586263 /DNA_START=36 /DNA_END=929 /DNA_ORIENTATION=-
MSATEGMGDYSCEKPIPVRANAVNAEYKRTFRICSNTGQLEMEKPDPALPEEAVLADNAAKFSVVRLFRGQWDEGDRRFTSGTYFPVTPETSMPRIFASAGHCVYAKQLRFKGTTDIHAGSSIGNFPYHSTEPLDLGWVKKGLEPEDLREYAPSGRQISVTSEVQPDFGFVKLDYSPHKYFVIPCAPPPPDTAVGVIGYAAQPTAGWAQTYMRTEADYRAANEAHLSTAGESSTDPTDPKPLDESAFALDIHVAGARVLNLLNDALHVDNLAVAPGFITASSTRIVEHSCSTFPGMSG